MNFHRVAPLALVVAVLTVAGCNDPSKDHPQATVAPTEHAAPAADSAPAPAAPAAAAAPADATMAATQPAAAAMTTWSLDPTNTRLGFIGSKVTGQHEGSFPKLAGSLSLNGTDPMGGSVTVEIDMTALEADNPKLVGHLKSLDFFDVEKFPAATFASTAITAGGEGGTHTITGDLNLHGVTKSISFPVTIAVTDTAVTAVSEFSINRQDFGVAYPGKPDDLIRDGVVLKIDISIPRS